MPSRRHGGGVGTGWCKIFEKCEEDDSQIMSMGVRRDDAGNATDI